jgi:hypothetical protein
VITNAGITRTNKELLINAIDPTFSTPDAIYDASLVDTLGRREMLMGGLAGGLFAYVLFTAFTATAKPDNNLAYGAIISIYLFGICFAWGWTPFQTLYRVECLENRTRAKGSSLIGFFLNAPIVANTHGISISMVGWKLYLVYIGWICVETTTIYL